MRFIFHNERFFTPESFTIWQRSHPEDVAHCHKCHAVVHAYGVNSKEATSRFDHSDNSGPCEYKLSSQPPEWPRNHAPLLGKELRKNFLTAENICFGFKVCQAMICGDLKHERFVPGNFKPRDFVNLILYADMRGLWNYRGLTPKLVPFFLLSTQIFSVRFSKNADESMRHPITFVLSKTEEPESWRSPFQPRSKRPDPTKPIYLHKCFINPDGSLGGDVTKADAKNPYLVSEENAQKLGGNHFEECMKPELISKILLAVNAFN